MRLVYGGGPEGMPLALKFSVFCGLDLESDELFDSVDETPSLVWGMCDDHVVVHGLYHYCHGIHTVPSEKEFLFGLGTLDERPERGVEGEIEDGTKHGKE